MMYLKMTRRINVCRHVTLTPDALGSFARLNVFQFLFDFLTGSRLSLAKQLQIIIGHQANQIGFTVDVFLILKMGIRV